MFKNLVLIAHYMSMIFRFTRDCLTWMSIIERQLQLCLGKLQQWATDNSFRLCMHICQKRGHHLNPWLSSGQKTNPGSGGDQSSEGYI